MADISSCPGITVCRLRVVMIAGISPLIWQRLEVAAGTTVAGLHAIVQAVFGWSGEYLHRFVIGGTEYGISYLGGLTDESVADTASWYADLRPSLDPVSATALGTPKGEGPADPDDDPDGTDPKGWRGGKRRADPDALLWDALQFAPADGVSVADLMRVTGMSRSWVYYRLADHAEAGRAIQTTRGCWRAAPEAGNHA